ncbi:hypothetical protein C455_03604 [Haloferax larsenii JCM 13917]|nr:hypothetical protein C455_03604 [Haloferax larsenii JCM 13917]
MTDGGCNMVIITVTFLAIHLVCLPVLTNEFENCDCLRAGLNYASTAATGIFVTNEDWPSIKLSLHVAERVDFITNFLKCTNRLFDSIFDTTHIFADGTFADSKGLCHLRVAVQFFF